MRSPNKLLINIFRGIMVTILFLNVLNGAISDNPRFSKISSWGPLWHGLFLTTLISWAILELANLYFKKTKVGHLPSYFWFIAAGLNGADFFNNYSLLFEIPNFDKLAHALGGFFFGMLMLGLIKRIDQSHNIGLSRFLIFYLTIATVNLGGVIYEIGELIGDKYFGSRNITGFFDTTEDLVFNNVGLFILLGIDWLVNKLTQAKNKNAAA